MSEIVHFEIPVDDHGRAAAFSRAGLGCRSGGTVLQAKVANPGVGWSAYVVDSEGNTVGLFEPEAGASAP